MGGEEEEGPLFKPELSEKEEQQAEERAAIGARVVHEAIRREGEDELSRPTAALA